MAKPSDIKHLKADPTAVSRKKDHIEMAFRSAVSSAEIDQRFYYEPMLVGHPTELTIPKTPFLGHELDLPIWVSSMTGGTEWAKTINTNLAKACGEYGMGMGLGSCRALLMEDDRLDEFAVKKYMPAQPLYANLGVAQVEELWKAGQLSRVTELLDKLDADGLIVHVNPLQEWLQPEGDRYFSSPLDLVKRLLDACPDVSIVVKEVGQGFGPKSIRALYQLPIQAVDFAASGGTNFALLELLRSEEDKLNAHQGLTRVGHDATEMVQLVNKLFTDHLGTVQCPATIISGGISDYLDGYYAISKLKGVAIYGQASAFLKHARNSYEELQQHVEQQQAGLQVAYGFLTVK